VVGGDSIHVDCLLGDATEEIASANDDANLAAQRVNLGYLFGYFVNEYSVDAKTLTCSQGFA
jgi:hypothetical protein